MRALAFLCLALPACTAPDYIRVDARFTAEEQQLIRQAAGNWQLATGAQINLVFGETVDTDTSTFADCTLVRTFARDPAVLSTTRNGDEYETPLLANKRLLVVVDNVARTAETFHFTYPDLFLYVTTHELGHWLGMDHINSATAIMRPGTSLGDVIPSCVTQEDAFAFCAITNGCRADQMKGCVP